MTSVAGVDRWRGGWIAAVLDESQLSFVACPDAPALIVALADCATVAIDMPIALAATGRREAEAALRQILGRASRSVFTSPTRAASTAATQAQATEINRAHGGPGISAQAFGLFASICELRETLAGPQFHHWHETHPETAFVLLGNGEPLASKKTGRGVAERLLLLRQRYLNLEQAMLLAPDKVPVDDVLDAVAAAWSAERIHAGNAELFGPPGRDDEGFTLGIAI